MSFIPGHQVTDYLGNMNLFVIRETSSVREFGGISGFMHKFVAEVLALMRAHVAALGGNALLAFNLNQCVLLDNPNRNQAQCLINIAGDAVRVEPEKSASWDLFAGGVVNGTGVSKHVFPAGRSASPQSPKLRTRDIPNLKEENENVDKAKPSTTETGTTEEEETENSSGAKTTDNDNLNGERIANDLIISGEMEKMQLVS